MLSVRDHTLHVKRQFQEKTTDEELWPSLTQTDTCKQILHFLDLPELLVLLDVAGCLLSFYMRPFPIVEPVRKQTRVACFQLVIILFMWNGSFKKRRLMRNYGLPWHRQTHVNRFYIFLAYRGFWFCLMWLVASSVFNKNSRKAEHWQTVSYKIYMRPFANVQPFRKKARVIVLHVKENKI